MTTFWNKLTRFSTLRWWLVAVLSFWLFTGLFAFVDFAGARWFGLTWPSGPDLFPNMALGYPLALFQIVAGVFLVASGIRLARSRTGIKGITLGVALVAATGLICLVAYALFALWYHIDFMGRPV
jgi:hypothetical protein